MVEAKKKMSQKMRRLFSCFSYMNYRPELHA
jgi:hypothetical protein